MYFPPCNHLSVNRFSYFNHLHFHLYWTQSMPMAGRFPATSFDFSFCKTLRTLKKLHFKPLNESDEKLFHRLQLPGKLQNLNKVLKYGRFLRLFYWYEYMYVWNTLSLYSKTLTINHVTQEVTFPLKFRSCLMLINLFFLKYMWQPWLFTRQATVVHFCLFSSWKYLFQHSNKKST